ncbi:hypothetical protein [Demequina zhanjiangensis]|uniref:Uncharacterized protein n=1 Tax=Demequina zhanjiangensis TaxID=3051659 RepID=A0ABT8FZR7_9MICO|nr:hypothetical protein [Demequina sp. SYSU T00b26]MDN4472352.1 hypothetical protein [Demequina sp. SYSU T00b26]
MSPRPSRDTAPGRRDTHPVKGAGSVFGSVVALMGRGFTPAGAARELGIRGDVADAVAAEALRLGLVVDTGTACGTGCIPGAKVACAGCPLSR